MRVLFAGTPEAALPSLRALIDSPDHEVVGVLTRPDARRGRGRALSPSPVAALARAADLDVRTPATLRDAAARDWVRSLGADVAVVVAYGRIVPPALLDAPAHGWINLHFSLLPACAEQCLRSGGGHEGPPDGFQLGGSHPGDRHASGFAYCLRGLHDDAFHLFGRRLWRPVHQA